MMAICECERCGKKVVCETELMEYVHPSEAYDVEYLCSDCFKEALKSDGITEKEYYDEEDDLDIENENMTDHEERLKKRRKEYLAEYYRKNKSRIRKQRRKKRLEDKRENNE